MKDLGFQRAAGALAIVVVATFLIAGAKTALAQDDTSGADDQTRARIQRLERDVHDLQQELYRGNGGGGAAPRSLAPAADDVPTGQTAPLTQRLNDLENSVQRLTGQMEELQHQNEVLSTKVDRLQRTLDFQQNSTPVGPQGAATPSPSDTQVYGDTSTPPRGVPSAAAEPRSLGPGLAPGPSNLGTIPENTPLPHPKPGGGNWPAETAAAPAPGTRVASLPPSAATGGAGAQAEYDSAMALLRKAQYEAAQQAFRNFADLHPADAHAPDALFWTGDIAYSARHDYGSAARAFAELLKKYGKAGRAPEGMLKLGLSLMSLGQKQEGCATLAALPVKYANAAPALVARAAAERKRAACT